MVAPCHLARTTAIVNNMPPRKLRARHPSPRRVVVLVYDGLCTFEFGIATEMFGLPRPEFFEWYSYDICAIEPGPIRATGGVHLAAKRNLAKLAMADTIIVPGWKKPYLPPPVNLVRALRTAHSRGARLVSICTGSFVLGAAGLLDGRRATTHWRFVEEMKERFPRVQLEPDVLYVDEGDILTSAGSAAGIDLCLHIIRKDFGTAIANKVAKRAVVAPHREGGQAQFVDRTVGEEGRPWLAHLFEWCQKHLDAPLTIDQLAHQARMSKRTLSRRFTEATGLSPLVWLTSLRVRHAKDLLEASTFSIEEISEKCGFGSAATLRHHFRSLVRVSPKLYRERFRRS